MWSDQSDSRYPQNSSSSNPKKIGLIILGIVILIIILYIIYLLVSSASQPAVVSASPTWVPTPPGSGSGGGVFQGILKCLVLPPPLCHMM